jgi:hypothetical protein
MECISKLDEIQDRTDIIKTIKHIEKNKKIYVPKLNNKDKNITFEDLDEYLHNNIKKYNKIHEFIQEFSIDNQQLFEPQESIFRYFAIKKLLIHDLIKNVKITFKNYGKGDILNDEIYEPKNYYKMYLKDMGDISDLTFIDHINKKIIIATSKNYKDYSGKGKKFDLAKIKLVYNDKYINSGYELQTILLVRDKNEVYNAINKMSFSSYDSKKLVENSIILDWDDLNKSYRKLKYGYNKPLHMNLYDEYKNTRIIKNWNINDENLCKNIDINNYSILLKRHDKLKEYIQSYSFNEIKEYYNQFFYISLIKINGNFIDKIHCLLGNKIFINEELNIKIELNKNNMLNRIQKYNIINTIKIIVNNDEEKEIITEYINKNKINKDIEIYKINESAKITNGDIIINLTKTNLKKLYIKIINSNKCKFIIDENIEDMKKWLNINEDDIENCKLINTSDI